LREESVDMMTRDYRTFSFWLETIDDDLTPRAPLDGSTDVDVAILGAGYTGLWTGYYLLERDPSLKVAVVEKEIAGFGASGRNGGFLSPGFPVSLGLLEERYGLDQARRLYLAMTDTVNEVLRVLDAEGIDAHQEQSGAIRMARGPHQLAGIEGSYQTYRRMGLEEHAQLLDAHEVAERVRVTKALKGIFNPTTAVVHPGRLVRGLARAVERKGGVIYEQTRVLDYETGLNPRLMTDHGDVRARVIVLAGESYLSQLPKLRRALIPVYSLIALTEPLSDEQWAEIGWEKRYCIGSIRFSVDYLSKTKDGRIAFGGRGAPYHFGSRISDEFDRHVPTHRMLQNMTREWFPVLKDIRFTHSWGGPLGMPRDWMPTMSYDARTGLATARGYTGQGVATANLSGRVLTDLITGEQSDLTTLPPVNHENRNWEPEPLRWLGVRLVQSGFGALDAKGEATGKPPTGRSIAERLGRH
jgi:glycine/D-amino acid oxidase-like deaminating enzyme